MTSDKPSAVPAWKLRMQQRDATSASSLISKTTADFPPVYIHPNSSSHSSGSRSNSGSNNNNNNNNSIDAKTAQARLKARMEAATLDPNLPPAFKVANANRLAFARQQARRKNNDTWVSLNSSHINKEAESVAASSLTHEYGNGGDDDDDSSFVSMAGGEDDEFEEIVEEEDDYDEE